MSESQPNMEELLAQASDKAASIQQEREQKAADDKQAAVTSQVDKLYADREEQVALNSDISNTNTASNLKWQHIRALNNQKTQVFESKKEADAAIADEQTPDEVKSLYRQVQTQAGVDDRQIDEKIAQTREAIQEANELVASKTQKIDQTTAEAEKIMGLSPEVRRQEEIFPALQEYVIKRREIAAQAKEVEMQFDINKLVERIYSQIITGTQRSRRDRNEWSDKRDFEYDLDLNFREFGSTEAASKLVSNPELLQRIKEGILKKIQETFASNHSQPGDNHEQEAVKAANSSLNLIIGGGKDQVKVQVWNGAVGWGGVEKWESKDVSAAGMPHLPYSWELSDEQKAKLEAAIKDTNMPMQELKTSLGFKFNPETVGRIKEDALVEDREFNRQRELKDIQKKIEGLVVRIDEIEREIVSTQEQVVILQKNLDYDKAGRAVTVQGEKIVRLQKELSETQITLRDLPKGFFGGVKDKIKQEILTKKIENIGRELPQEQQVLATLKEKQEGIKLGLGSNLMRDSYRADDRLEIQRSILNKNQTELQKMRTDLQKLESRRSALESTKPK